MRYEQAKSLIHEPEQQTLKQKEIEIISIFDKVHNMG